MKSGFILWEVLVVIAGTLFVVGIGCGAFVFGRF